jgi:hypothetical protein
LSRISGLSQKKKLFVFGEVKELADFGKTELGNWKF